MRIKGRVFYRHKSVVDIGAEKCVCVKISFKPFKKRRDISAFFADISFYEAYKLLALRKNGFERLLEIESVHHHPRRVKVLPHLLGSRKIVLDIKCRIHRAYRSAGSDIKLLAKLVQGFPDTYLISPLRAAAGKNYCFLHTDSSVKRIIDPPSAAPGAFRHYRSRAAFPVHTAKAGNENVYFFLIIPAAFKR